MLSPRNKRLCIVGSAPTKADAPYEDKSFDIWAVSNALFSESLDGVRRADTEDNSWNSVTRVDVFFEMHKRRTFVKILGKLQSCRAHVIMQQIEKDIPNSKVYPLKEVLAYGDDFRCTVSYMVAMAILEGYKEIRLYGVILMHESEYIAQRPSVKYWLGVARGMGIEIWAHEETQLTSSSWRYGYDDHDDICNQIKERKKLIQSDIRNQARVLGQLEGALMTCDNLINEIKGSLE